MEFVTRIDTANLTPEQINAVVAGAVAIGTLYCFLGYRAVKFIVGLTGFLLAGTVAGTLVNWITEGHAVAMAGAVLIGGISGMFAVLFLYKAGIFFVGMLGTTVVAHNALSSFEDSWVPLMVLGLGLVGGLFALLVEKPVILVATSAIGAWMVVSGIVFFVLGSSELSDILQTYQHEGERTIILGSWAVLALSGALSQFATRKQRPKLEDE